MIYTPNQVKAFETSPSERDFEILSTEINLQLLRFGFAYASIAFVETPAVDRASSACCEAGWRVDIENHTIHVHPRTKNYIPK